MIEIAQYRFPDLGSSEMQERAQQESIDLVTPHVAILHVLIPYLLFQVLQGLGPMSKQAEAR